MKNSYTFIVRYNIHDIREDLDMGYLFADNYLIKLMKDYNVVYLGVETELKTGDREHFFRSLELNVTLSCLGEFSQQDEDFTKSYMKPPEEDGEGSLTMEYSAESYEPFSDDEKEYTEVSMSFDPRSTIAAIDEMLDDEDDEDDEDDDPSPNPGLFSHTEELVQAIRKDPLVGSGTCSSIDEAMEDDEIASALAEDGITTVEAAIKWARDDEEMWLEQGLNQRPGEDDDPQLLRYNEWRAERARLEGR